MDLSIRKMLKVKRESYETPEKEVIELEDV